MSRTKTVVLLLLATPLFFILSFIFFRLSNAGDTAKFPEVFALAYKGYFGKASPIAFLKVMNDPSIKTVTIETMDADIFVVPSNSSQLEIEFKGTIGDSDKKGKMSPVEIISQAGELTIKTIDTLDQKKSFLTLRRFSGHLEVRLPKGIKNLSVNSINGDTAVNDLVIDTFTSKNNSGSISADALTVGETNLVTTSGDVQVSHLDSKIGLGLKTVSGDIDVDFEGLSPTVSATTVSGDVTLGFNDTPDLKVQYSTNSGNLNVDSDLANIPDDGTDFKFVLNNGSGNISIKTVSGDFNLSKL